MGNQAGKFLAYLVRQHNTSNMILQIRSPDGSLNSTTEGILQCFYNYYKGLYESKSGFGVSDCLGYLSDITLPVLSSAQQTFMDAEFTLEEVEQAITDMASGKAPGPDGFPVELYRRYRGILAPLLLKVFKEIWKGGCLPDTFYEAHIIVLKKEGKDPLECGSYRPISLVNVDYKILAKILATRLNSIILDIIHPDQTGFMLAIEALAVRLRSSPGIDGIKIADRTDIIGILKSQGPQGLISSLYTYLLSAGTNSVVDSELSLLPLMEPSVTANFSLFAPFGSSTPVNGKSPLKGSFGSGALDSIPDYYTQLLSKNNLSNPPTPPSSLPPTPPPSVQQKMMNGVTATEDLNETKKESESSAEAEVKKGTDERSLDLLAALPTPPHNQSEDVRMESDEESDCPDSIVPASSPESVIGEDTQRFPSLCDVKEEEEERALSPVIPLIPRCPIPGRLSYHIQLSNLRTKPPSNYLISTDSSSLTLKLDNHETNAFMVSTRPSLDDILK
ncbi:unnamed protein product [Ranitomeya imitator]|uniref:Reverse transcriptase domain-containing protein n=1 Tax=Ranitomeya imitator TaxID=111125 RepID=A0ABN9MG33_9NEOB|nr:unnamed protein product [Ranitomeya imitator]